MSSCSNVKRLFDSFETKALAWVDENGPRMISTKEKSVLVLIMDYSSEKQCVIHLQN